MVRAVCKLRWLWQWGKIVCLLTLQCPLECCCGRNISLQEFWFPRCKKASNSWFLYIHQLCAKWDMFEIAIGIPWWNILAKWRFLPWCLSIFQGALYNRYFLEYIRRGELTNQCLIASVCRTMWLAMMSCFNSLQFHSIVVPLAKCVVKVMDVSIQSLWM